MDHETIGKVADATKAVAETGGKAIEATTKFGTVIKGPIDDLVGIVQDRVRFARWTRQLALVDKAKRIMAERGIKAPSRELPLNFAVPLLTSAVLEEDDELQEIWAKLLVNAGDASTEIELRTAYVDILRSMSAFDVKNLAVMAQTSLAIREQVGISIPILETWNLPDQVIGRKEAVGSGAPLSEAVEISINNLFRLGCIAFAASTFGGQPLFAFATVTSLGMGLHEACS